MALVLRHNQGIDFTGDIPFTVFLYETLKTSWKVIRPFLLFLTPVVKSTTFLRIKKLPFQKRLESCQRALFLIVYIGLFQEKY